MFALGRAAARGAAAARGHLPAAAGKVATRALATGSSDKAPVRVAVTGAAGAIGYSMLFRIASGELLGPDQPVILHMIEIPPGMKALEGVMMELEDCAFPLVHGMVGTDDLNKGFENVDHAILVGAKPRTKGMERGDLLKENGKIFVAQGKAINDSANRATVRVTVVGNPANTNCLIAAHNAPDIPAERFTALTRLDQDRGLAQLATKAGCHTTDIEKFCIWGNHSATQFPDISYATAKGTPMLEALGGDNDETNDWVFNKFIPRVQQRGAEIIGARGASSAASAANAAIMHARDWALGAGDRWLSMAIPSDGSYGVDAGVYYSYPVLCNGGSYEKVEGLAVSAKSAELMDKTAKELFAERDAVAHLLK